MRNTYNDRFIELGNKYVDWFLAGKFEFDQLVKFPSHMEVLYELYSVLVRSRNLMRIEKLDLKEKNEIWEMCKPFTKTLNEKDCIKFCKCYWALSYLAQKRIA